MFFPPGLLSGSLKNLKDKPVLGVVGLLIWAGLMACLIIYIVHGLR
jgi:hypothetical protein